jgi:hypothetical protein
MVTDGRVKELRRLLGMGRTLADSARMAEQSSLLLAAWPPSFTSVSFRGTWCNPTRIGRMTDDCAISLGPSAEGPALRWRLDATGIVPSNELCDVISNLPPIRNNYADALCTREPNGKA